MGNVIPQSNIIWMVVTAVILFFIPIVFILGWKMAKKGKVSMMPLLIGAVGFIVSARILEMIPHMFCIVLDNPVSRFITGNTVAYVLYGIAMAGIFEECGRYILMKGFMKKHMTRENSVMYGIGHGGAEVLAISLLATVNYLIIAIMANTQGTEQMMQTLNMAGDTSGQVQMLIGVLQNYGVSASFWTVFERLVCMGVHICLTIIVFYSVKKNQKRYLLRAVLVHAVFDIFPALYQRGAVSMLICEIWLVICFIFLALWAKQVYGKCKE